MRGPGIKQKSSTNIMIGNVDIMPSVLDLAGIAIPDNVDGKSWAPYEVNSSQMIENENEWRQVFLSEYMAHANQYFSICGTWFPQQGNFEGQVIHPNASDSVTNEYIWVDYGLNQDALGSNTWRSIRIINDTNNWSYSEYVNHTFTQSDKENPYLRLLFDVDKDPYQIDNIYQTVDEDIQNELHVDGIRKLQCF